MNPPSFRRIARSARSKRLGSLSRAAEGEPRMETSEGIAAAILVQTIFLKDGHLQALLGEQASKSPEAAAEFLKPYYVAALAMTAKTKQRAAG